MSHLYVARGWIGTAVALVAAASLVTVTPTPALALTGTSVARHFYGYPYPNALDCNEQNGHDCAPDQWGFTQGQCHSWVAFRLNQLNAPELHDTKFSNHWRQPNGQHWGGVSHWGIAAEAAHIRVDGHPGLGSLAWWSADGGHVGYVEAIDSDGSVVISEMNRNWHNSFDFARLQRGQRWPTGFIHIADRPASASVPRGPGGVHPVPVGYRVNLSWTTPSSGGSPIKTFVIGVYRDSTMIEKLSVGSSHYTNISGLSPGSYTFVVLATNKFGAGLLSTRSPTVTVH